MAKTTGNSWRPAPLHKKTSQTKRKASVKMSSMNKSKKRGFKAYNGQG